MKKGQVDVAVQRESSTDSTQSAREVNSTPSRRKRTLHTETCGTRSEETTESSVEKKASPKKVASKKNGKTKAKSSDEQTVPSDDLSKRENVLVEANDERPSETQETQTLAADPFPNEPQPIISETDFNIAGSYDSQPSSDRFFCSDEEFLRDKFNMIEVDEFDDDFDEDFIQLDDMEFNESLDEPYDEGDDSFEYSDEDLDSDSEDDDFDKLDSDENLLDDEEDFTD